MHVDSSRVKYEQTRRTNNRIIQGYKQALNQFGSARQQVSVNQAKINKVLDSQISNRRKNIEEESLYHVFQTQTSQSQVSQADKIHLDQ